MPLTLNVGLSKKIGLPSYGSLGASCHVEMELESRILERGSEQFHQEVRAAYAACRRAIDEELALAQDLTSSGAHAENSPDRAPHGLPVPCNPITEKQLQYIHRLAEQIADLNSEDLDGLARQTGGCSLTELTSSAASQLIGTLRKIGSGQLDPWLARRAA